MKLITEFFATLAAGDWLSESLCDKIGVIWGGGYLKMPESAFAGSCLNMYQIDTYLDGKDGHFWHISNLKIYDAPETAGANLWGYGKRNFGYAPVEIKRPPQSWCYVEEKEDSDG